MILQDIHVILQGIQGIQGAALESASQITIQAINYPEKNC